MSADFDWTSERIAKLRELDAKGLGMAEIARHFGVSPSAVIGARHRNGMGGRASPIPKGKATPSPTPIPRAGKITLPPLASVAASTFAPSNEVAKSDTPPPGIGHNRPPGPPRLVKLPIDAPTARPLLEELVRLHDAALGEVR